MAGVVCDAADLEGDVPDRVEREKWDYPCVGAEVVRDFDSRNGARKRFDGDEPGEAGVAAHLSAVSRSRQVDVTPAPTATTGLQLRLSSVCRSTSFRSTAAPRVSRPGS
jgi:hypothetical protein